MCTQCTNPTSAPSVPSATSGRRSSSNTRRWATASILITAARNAGSSSTGRRIWPFIWRLTLPTQRRNTFVISVITGLQRPSFYGTIWLRIATNGSFLVKCVVPGWRPATRWSSTVRSCTTCSHLCQRRLLFSTRPPAYNKPFSSRTRLILWPALRSSLAQRRLSITVMQRRVARSNPVPKTTFVFDPSRPLVSSKAGKRLMCWFVLAQKSILAQRRLSIKLMQHHKKLRNLLTRCRKRLLYSTRLFFFSKNEAHVLP